MVEGKEIKRDFNRPIRGNTKSKGKNAKDEISMSKILSITVSKARGRRGTVRNKNFTKQVCKKQVRETEKCGSLKKILKRNKPR